MLQSLKDQIDDLITSLPYHQMTLTEVILILLEQAVSGRHRSGPLVRHIELPI